MDRPQMLCFGLPVSKRRRHMSQGPLAAASGGRGCVWRTQKVSNPFQHFPVSPNCERQRALGDDSQSKGQNNDEN